MLLTLLGNQTSVPVDPPVVPSYVWASAWGMAWGDAWGDSWGPLHQVDELRRPRTHPNLKFTGIREGHGVVRGAGCSATAGKVPARGSRDTPIHHGRRAITGAAVGASMAGVTSRGGARFVVPDTSVRSATGRVVGRSGARATARGTVVSVKSYRIASHGEACSSIVSPDTFAFVGRVSARGIRNPTDEQLAHIAHLLTRKRF